MRETVGLIYFNAGGGHRAAAQALQAVTAQQQRPWRVRCVNLVHVLDPQGSFQRLTGMAPEDLYNKRLAKGWTGPGSLREAVQQGLPVVTLRNAWTLPQERYNTDWVQATGVGLVGKSVRNLRPVVLDLMGRLASVQASVQRLRNRAVFEVPDILASILAGGAQPRAGAVALRPPAPAAPVGATQPASLVG